MIVILFDNERDVVYCTSCTTLQQAKVDCQRWIDEQSDSWSFAGDWDDRFRPGGWFYSERKVKFSDPEGDTDYLFELHLAD